MAIIVNLDIMMARRKISLGELAEKIEYYAGQSVYIENRKGKSNPVLNT